MTKWWLMAMAFSLMAEAGDGNGGGAGDQGGGAGDQGNGDQGNGDQGNGDQGSGAGDQGNQGAGDQGNQGGDKGGKSLLDDDDDQGNQGGDQGNGDQPPTGPSEEDVAKFLGGITKDNLGEGVEFSDATMKAMAPALMELTGGDAKKAQGVVNAYAKYVATQMKAAAEAEAAFNKAQMEECKTRFGEDLKKVANYAKAGGKAIFGDKIWNTMKTIPAFANNADIIERLAEYGRKIAQDGGHSSPKGGAATEDKGDLLSRMYSGVTV